jgi:hypothetical protein
MDQHPTIPNDFSSDLEDQVLLSPTPSEADVPSPLVAERAGRRAAESQVRVRANVTREVVVLEVAGHLSDAVEDLDRAIQLALADGPRGVVCDLSSVPEGAETVAIEVLATAGRHVRDWPAVPVAVAYPDAQAREALRAHPLGGHLIATPSLFAAISAVMSTPTLAANRLRLTPHPTAPRAAREFVSRVLLDWRLRQVIPFASLVMSELVVCSSMNSGTDIDLSVVWDPGALRLTVRDHGPGLPGHRDSDLDLPRRSLTVVAGLARAFGVLPTADGGKVVWAVLDAPRLPPPITPDRSATGRQESLIRHEAARFGNGRAQAINTGPRRLSPGGR